MLCGAISASCFEDFKYSNSEVTRIEQHFKEMLILFDGIHWLSEVYYETTRILRIALKHGILSNYKNYFSLS